MPVLSYPAVGCKLLFIRRSEANTIFKTVGDELSFYCRKCTIPICLRCKVTSHEQHPTEDLSDVASEIRVLLTDMLKEAQNVLPKFHSHLNDITFYNDQLGNEREKLKNEITDQVKSRFCLVLCSLRSS